MAYQDLQYDRPSGMTAGPIPWSSIKSWGQTHGVTDPDDLHVLVTHIRALENAAESLEQEPAKNEQ
ncbi:MAG: hypothetical protein JWO78_211 [Micavibrio sp.]|nr:hypothetical protein [Micavibrio sp.]